MILSAQNGKNVIFELKMRVYGHNERTLDKIEFSRQWKVPYGKHCLGKSNRILVKIF